MRTVIGDTKSDMLKPASISLYEVPDIVTDFPPASDAVGIAGMPIVHIVRESVLCRDRKRMRTITKKIVSPPAIDETVIDHLLLRSVFKRLHRVGLERMSAFPSSANALYTTEHTVYRGQAGR